MFSLMQMPRTTVAVQRLQGGETALYRRADQSDHRRRHGLLRHARRHPHRRARRGDRLRRRARHRADDPRAPAGRLPARRISAVSTAWSTWSCRAARCARRSRRLCAPADARAARAGRGARNGEPPERAWAPSIARRHSAAFARAASAADRPVARPHRTRCSRALGDPQNSACRRSSMSPAPTARARPSPSCARCSRPPASACMSTPRRISCASTSASASPARLRRRGRARRGAWRPASASMPARRSPSSRSPRRRRCNSSARRRPIICCSKSGSAGGSTRPMSIARPAATRHHAGLARPSGISRRHGRQDRLREGRHSQARRARGHRPSRSGGARGDRARGGAAAARPLIDRGRGFPRPRRNTAAWSTRTQRGLLDLPLPRLPGRHQHQNAGDRASPPCARRARPCRTRPSSAAWSRPNGRRGCRRLARGQLRRLAPAGAEIWLDGGHNEAGGRVLAEAMADFEEKAPRPLVLICGTLATKDTAAFLADFKGLAREVSPCRSARTCRAAGRRSGGGGARGRHRREHPPSVPAALQRARRPRLARPAADFHRRLALSRRRGAEGERDGGEMMRSALFTCGSIRY